MNLFTGAHKYFEKSTFITHTMGPSLFKDEGAKVEKLIIVQEGINVDMVQKSFYNLSTFFSKSSLTF